MAELTDLAVLKEIKSLQFKGKTLKFLEVTYAKNLFKSWIIEICNINKKATLSINLL